MAAERHLSQLCTSAGDRAPAALLLLQKVFGNIKDNPTEAKYRQLKLDNQRLQSELLRFDGASKFLKAAGFNQTAPGIIELSPGAAVAFNDAYAVLRRRYSELSEARQRVAINKDGEQADGRLYREAVEGGARGAGRPLIDALRGRPEGREALQVLEKSLLNVKMYPDSERYRSVKLSSKGGQKLVPALELCQLAGFRVDRAADHAVLAKVDLDVVERLWAMAFWALSPAAAEVQLPQLPGPAFEHVFGAVLGAAVGDALGAPLEMLERMPMTAAEVDKAFEMCGGGHWGTAPGQITDDTEQAISLARGLAASGPPAASSAGTVAGAAAGAAAFPREEVSRQYCNWGQSRPFDWGQATRTAFGRISSAADMARRALSNNMESQANGSLMRCTPLVAWGVGQRLDIAGLAEATRVDTRLSHPNPVIVEATATYVVALAHLVQSGGDRRTCLGAVAKWMADEKAGVGPGMEAVEEWMSLAHSDQTLPFDPQGGQAQVAFTHAFRHLRQGSTFEQAMRATLAGGGDTGSNAAIVGGLLGAAVGVRGIPEHWLRAVLSADAMRPDDYHPRQLPPLLLRLCCLVA